MSAGPGERSRDGWGRLADGGDGWIDLSHAITPAVPRLAGFAPPAIRKLASMPADPFSVTALEIVCHTGTHIDAPCHFIPGAPAIDQIPLERLTGPGVVLRPPPASRGERPSGGGAGEGERAHRRGRRAEAERAHVPGRRADAGRRLEGDGRRGGELGREDLEAVAPAPGEIAILDSGWWHTGGGDGDHPWLSEDAARWLVERGVKLLATDLPTPDLPACRRRPDFDWPVHRILLGAGVPIAENLTNLASLPERVEVMLLPLPIAGADGSPARVLARPRGPC